MKINQDYGKLVDGELECAPTYLKGDGETISVPTEEQYLAFGWKKVNYEEPTADVPEGYRRKGIIWAEDGTTIFRKPLDKKLVDDTVWPEGAYRILSDYWEETDDSFVRHVIVKPEIDETVWPEEPYRIISDEWEETETEFVRNVVVKHIVDNPPTDEPKIGYHWEATGEDETETEITIVYTLVKNPPRKISKLKLIVALKAAGKWDAVKAFISSAGYEDEWQAAQVLDEGYPQYDAAKNAVMEAGIATEEEIETIVSQSIADTSEP